MVPPNLLPILTDPLWSSDSYVMLRGEPSVAWLTVWHPLSRNVRCPYITTRPWQNTKLSIFNLFLFYVAKFYKVLKSWQKCKNCRWQETRLRRSLWDDTRGNKEEKPENPLIRAAKPLREKPMEQQDDYHPDKGQKEQEFVDWRPVDYVLKPWCHFNSLRPSSPGSRITSQTQLLCRESSRSPPSFPPGPAILQAQGDKAAAAAAHEPYRPLLSLLLLLLLAPPGWCWQS